MPWSGYAAMTFTVLLLVTTAYFILGGLPLLILKHDTPVDGRFIRRFFDVYYKAALITAVGAAISYAFWGRPYFAAGTAGMAVLALLLHRRVIPTMEQVGAQIQANDTRAIGRFRRLHSATLLANLVLLVSLVWGVIQIRL